MHRSLLGVVIALIFSACSSDDDPVDCEKSGPAISLENVVDASSCSTHDGQIKVNVSGGKEPYNFFINDQAVGSTDAITDLAAGSYSVRVTDANHCSASVDNISILASDFSFTADILANTSCLAGNGAVTINVENNNPPYSFQLGNGSFSANNVFAGLKTGSHSITVQDNNNCRVTLSVSIPRGSSGTSWTDDIKPIMEKHCATSGCHNGVSRSTNFLEYSSAKTYASSIKSKTRDRSMPFDGSLTQSQIDLISCWVDDGALQN
jgi:hypothetical protein